MPALRWRFAFAGALVLACAFAGASPAAACGKPGYAYAGVVMPSRVHGIRAIVTARPLSSVTAGHVSAWVGLGKVRASGKRGRIRAGLIAEVGQGYRVYSEIKRQGRWQRRLGPMLAPGVSAQVSVVEMRGRPGWWRVWVNRRPFGSPVYLRSSARGLRPLATAERWDGGGIPCSRFEHRFRSIAVRVARRSRWQAPARSRVVVDSGYELIRPGGRSFLARTSAEPELPLGPRPSVGVNYHGIWDYASDEDRAIVLDKMAAAGLEWVRLDLKWASLEDQGPGAINASYLERANKAVDDAVQRGLRVLVVVYGTPGWANGNAGFNTPPTNPEDFGRIAEWLAAYFRGRVGAWEIWNEPNYTFMWTGTPAQYTSLVRAAYGRFKSGDPDAKVVFGGVAHNDDLWLTRAYEAGAAGYFDVLSTHPYQGGTDGAPETPDDGTIWWLTHVAAVHDLMSRFGDGGKEIWLTEFGWSVHEDIPGVHGGVTLEEQADYIVRTIEFVRRYPYVRTVFWYNERNAVTGNAHEDNFGLLRRDRSEKPVYTALQGYLLTHPAAP